MGRKLIVAAIAAAIGISTPAFLPDAGTASAQMGGCSCFAAYDAIDSDLRNLGRVYKQTTLGASGSGCASACSAWRREWFTQEACERPTRINRGTRAAWGYQDANNETFIGLDTWWCPFPPP